MLTYKLIVFQNGLFIKHLPMLTIWRQCTGVLCGKTNPQMDST